jgi:hypothetical protein
MDWTIPCKEAATLMVAREDRELALGERAALRWHLLLCHGCQRFEGQMLTMRNALSQWRHYRHEHPEAAGGTPSTGTGAAEAAHSPAADP